MQVVIKQSIKNTWRDWRAGELRVLLVAVALAVAALTSVSFFADRLKGGLQRDARLLLGGDVVVVSDQPTPLPFVEQAQSLGLKSARSVSFPSMARAPELLGGDSRLVALKAVSMAYPLRGALKVAAPSEAQTDVQTNVQTDAFELMQAPPEPGQVWVESALLEALNLRVGQTLLLGDSRLTIGRVLLEEPDRGAGFMNFAPRVLMNEADLPATGLVQPASRVNHRLLLVGSEAAVKSYRDWATQRLNAQTVPGLHLETLESGRPEMRATLDRAEKFLNLVALLTALLSAVAVAIAARSFAQRHLDECAMRRVLGQSQRQMAWGYGLEFFLLGIVGSGLGVGFGYGLHLTFVTLLAPLMTGALPEPSFMPAAWGLAMGLVLLLAFGLPPVLQLAKVPPLRVMRRDVGRIRATALGTLVLGLLGFALLLLGVAGDLKLGLMTVGGFALAAFLFAGVAWLAVRSLRYLVNEATAPTWLILATRQVTARSAYAVLQVSSLSLGLLALSLLVLLRTDLVDTWRQATPVNAPNRFVINIQPDQADAFKALLKSQGVQHLDWYPMVRGRLVAVNGQAVKPESYINERAKRLVDREFNVSFDAQAPDYNQVTQGRWLTQEADAFSVEEGLADTLGLKLGDRLRFDVAGELSEGRITSLRKVDWASMRVNFFVMAPQAQMPQWPHTYIAAFRAPQAGLDKQLSQQFPNLTVVDTTATVLQVQKVLNQVIKAIELLFVFALFAGVMVLMAALTATREERVREFAVLRSLGASRVMLQRVQQAELIGVGVLSGFLAALVAGIVAWALAHYVFDFAWVPAPWILLGTVVCGGVMALAAGWWGLRSVLRQPVVETLRRAQA